MSLSAKVLKPLIISCSPKEILPPEVVGWLTRTGKIVDMVQKGEVEVGRES